MLRSRHGMPALILTATIVLGVAGPLLAAVDAPCLAAPRGCGPAAAAASCCCVEAQPPAVTSAQDQASSARDVAAVPTVMPAVHAAVLWTCPGIVHTAALHGSPPDLFTLYATLLI